MLLDHYHKNDFSLHQWSAQFEITYYAEKELHDGIMSVSTKFQWDGWVHVSKKFKLHLTPKRHPNHYYHCKYLAGEPVQVDLPPKCTITACIFCACVCVCTFSVMSRSQESMLSVNRSSVLLPWLDPNTLWLAWNSWLQGGEDSLEKAQTEAIILHDDDDKIQNVPASETALPL